MARIKIAYIGGGSTRGPGTMASLIENGKDFDGSEIVLIDLNEERLELVRRFSEKLARVKGVDYTITTTTDRRIGLEDCDAVLSSFRPGGFEARAADERIPLTHGIIGQETQGPGGFFMALRSIVALKDITADMEKVCPKARIFNYTNPVNIVAQALTLHTPFPTVSLCEGPIIFPHNYARAAGLDIEKMDVSMIGLNHGCWSVRHLYDGQDIIPLLTEALMREEKKEKTNTHALRLLRLAVAMDSLAADYFQYYYYHDEILAEALCKPTTRAQDIVAEVPDYWRHYREQADADVPTLDPRRSRGGIHELELAIDVMDAIYNDKKEVWPVNVPNNGAISDFPDDLVVEVPGYVDKHGITPLVQGHMPRQVTGLLKMLGEYQALTAEAAWTGGRKEAIQALASNPLVFSIAKAEAVYDEMSASLIDYLPERLLA